MERCMNCGHTMLMYSETVVQCDECCTMFAWVNGKWKQISETLYWPGGLQVVQ